MDDPWDTAGRAFPVPLCSPPFPGNGPSIVPRSPVYRNGNAREGGAFGHHDHAPLGPHRRPGEESTAPASDVAGNSVNGYGFPERGDLMEGPT